MAVVVVNLIIMLAFVGALMIDYAPTAMYMAARSWAMCRRLCCQRATPLASTDVRLHRLRASPCLWTGMCDRD